MLDKEFYMINHFSALLDILEDGTIPFLPTIYADCTEEKLNSLVFDYLDTFIWYYNNTTKPEIKTYIKELISYYKKERPSYIINKCSSELLTDSQIDSITYLEDYLDIYYSLLQEFCIFRYNKDSGEAEFYITSLGFNWLPIIWKLVNKFNSDIKFISVRREVFRTGVDRYYTHRTVELNHINTDNFILLCNDELTDPYRGNEFLNEFSRGYYPYQCVEIQRDNPSKKIEMIEWISRYESYKI